MTLPHVPGDTEALIIDAVTRTLDWLDHAVMCKRNIILAQHQLNQAVAPFLPWETLHGRVIGYKIEQCSQSALLINPVVVRVTATIKPVMRAVIEQGNNIHETGCLPQIL